MLKFTMNLQQIIHVTMTIDYIDNYVLVQFNRTNIIHMTTLCNGNYVFNVLSSKLVICLLLTMLIIQLHV